MKRLFAALCLLQVAAAAQDVPSRPNLLRFAPLQVTESRASDGQAMLNVTSSISGAGLPPLFAVRSVVVTGALDNKGRELIPRDWLFLQMVRRGAGPTIGTGGIASPTASLDLPSAPRDATLLTHIVGMMQLLLPSEAKGSMVRVANIMSHFGLVEHPVLAKHRIQFRFHGDQKSYEQTMAEYPEMRTRPSPDFSAQVGYHQIDPLNLVAGIQLQDRNGAPIPVGKSSWWSNGPGKLGEIELLSPLPSDAQLVLFLALPEATINLTFRVENVPLP